MENIIHKSIFTHPLYLALKSADADEKLSIDAVLQVNTSREELATKQDFYALKEDLTKEIHVSHVNTLKWVVGINIAFYLGVIGVILGL